MTRVARLLHLDDGEFPALRAQIEDQSMPRVGIPATTRRPLRIDEQARSIAVLAGLYVEDRALGMRVPDATVLLRNPAPVHIRPEASLLAGAAVVSALRHAYDDVADELESALAELTELAPFAAKAGA